VSKCTRLEKKIVEDVKGWAEIFWVPLQDELWVKTWTKAAPRTQPTIPDHQLYDKITEILGKIGYTIFGTDVSKLYLDLTWEGLKLNLNKVHNWLRYDALHYRDYINDWTVECTEFALPIDDDYLIPWTAFTQLKESVLDQYNKGNVPCNLIFEMRFTSGTDVNIAHFPNKTSKKWVHMEILRSSLYSICNQTRREQVMAQWYSFVDEIYQKWSKIEQLKVYNTGPVPHWAKGWQSIPEIKKVLSDQVITDLFRRERMKADPKGKFMNALFADLFSDKPQSPTKSKEDQSNGF